MTVGSDKVIEVTCAALTMTFKWLDSWSEWKVFMDAPEVKELMQKNIDMAACAGSVSKGKGAAKGSTAE